MKKYFIICFLASLISCTKSIEEKDFITFFEKSNYLETPRYKETVEYCKKLATASSLINFTTIGKSARGLDIPMLIVDKEGEKNVQKIRNRGNIIVLIQACIHPGEPDGKDAGLMLLRDIGVLKKYPELLEKVSVLFLPVFSPDGHERFGLYNRINQNGPKEMGWRTNAQNLNLNRDFVKADAPEMRCWLKLFNEWLPEFTFDCHTTDGADYVYPLTYGMEIYGNTEENLTAWMKEKYLDIVKEKMEKKDMPMFPYIAFRQWFDPRSGLNSWTSAAMLCQGYASSRNRASLLIETHMLKDYKTRVFATYELLKESLTLMNMESENLKNIITKVDEETGNGKLLKKEFPIAFETAKDCVMVTLKGKEYTVEKSDLSGGDWIKYTGKDKDWEIPFFNKQIPSITTQLPQAYIVPPECEEIIKRLDWHNINFTTIQQEIEVEIETYKFDKVKFSASPFEGRQRIQNFDMIVIKEKRIYPVGSVIIPLKQKSARLIAYMFEPRCRDSFLQWGFFNAIFEQKEYGETYVMEKVAREMIQKNPKLLEELEAKKKTDESFAKNHWEILNWFYKQSDWKDQQMNVYPVGRIMYQIEAIQF
ncbi:MAG: hypothetical protein A2275_11910 [Bacteroidetes bacterium RIFOXYA12_FULL_35_11]|nr:MAG: hypothetical protein A2X01_21070 [Bacteroidetes bacterium GWF2_35_48]OFY81559.1 MAG: hypothetical protein A2275_11910 [Bacteroidetes bacterium RIFOXYA12_FULL_35_11]